jgi:hypothetical protein
LCIAVGLYQTLTAENVALVETLSGSTWAPTAPGEPSGVTVASLSAISCASTTFCVAIGEDEDSNGSHGLLETLSGGSWTSVSSPVPSGAVSSKISSLASVSCGASGSCVAASGSCVAVGTYETSSYAVPSLIDTLASGSWTGTAAPAASGSSTTNGLSAVSCATSTSCVAVGWYVDTSHYYHGLVETDSGSSWTASSGTGPANAGTDGASDEEASSTR